MIHCNVLRSEDLIAGLYTNYKGVWGPRVKCKWAPDKSGSTKAWCATWLRKVWRKKLAKKKMRNLWQKKMHKFWHKKSWRKLALGPTYRNQGPS